MKTLLTEQRQAVFRILNEGDLFEWFKFVEIPRDSPLQRIAQVTGSCKVEPLVLSFRSP